MNSCITSLSLGLLGESFKPRIPAATAGIFDATAGIFDATAGIFDTTAGAIGTVCGSWYNLY